MYVPQELRVLFNRIRGEIGWVYKSWRGEIDARYMASLRRSERFGIGRLKELQWKKVKSLIDHAYESVPFYRQQMNDLGARPSDIRTPDDFRKLPTLSKRDLRKRQKDLLSTKYASDSLRESWSGGSTGEPVRFYLDRRRVRLSTTDEIWADGWSGWKIGEPIARLWGASEATRPVSSYRRLIRRYVLNPGFMIEAYDLTRGTFVHFVDNYRRWSPTLIVGYASALRALSEFLLVEGLKLLPPKVVISSAELLDENTRLLIERAFCCPVMDRYGSREMGLMACQCLEGRQYHVNMQRIYLELITDQGKEASENESEKVVVTDLGNYGMPLIRYEIGDRARLSLKRQCACGRRSECLSLIEGRTVDFLIASDGKKVHGLYFNRHIFKVRGVSQYRLVQESRHVVRLQVIENEPITSEQIEGLIRLIREKIGENATVEFEKVASLPKTPSGKLRYVECHVRPDESNTLSNP